MNPPHKGQWRRALAFYLICAWINVWVNIRKAGDSRRHCPHYDVIVMESRDLSTHIPYGRFTVTAAIAWFPPYREIILTHIGECDRHQTTTKYSKAWTVCIILGMNVLIDDLEQDCSNSSALAMELLQFCIKPSKCPCQKKFDRGCSEYRKYRSNMLYTFCVYFTIIRILVKLECERLYDLTKGVHSVQI